MSLHKNEQVVLVQGGLEIPIKVTVTMKNTLENKQARTKYKELINHLYKELANRQFEDVTSQEAT